MAVNQTETYDQIGMREDLADNIWNVSPEEVPFSSGCSRVSVSNRLFDWQTDSLAAVSSTVAVEGAEATFSSAAATSRLQGITEIITKTVNISATVEAVDRAGRAKEMAYQVVKRAKEIKRDFEHHLLGLNQAANVGANDTVARITTPVWNWLQVIGANGNVSTAGTAATGTGLVAPVDGTQRAFTETLLGNVLDSCWANGGNPDVIMLGSSVKRVMNSFTGTTKSGSTAGNTQIYANEKAIINAVSVYESDYGVMKIVPNRFIRTRNVLVYEKKYWSIAELRGMSTEQLAKTGDSDKKMVVLEAGLMAKSPISSGAVLDCLTP